MQKEFVTDEEQKKIAMHVSSVSIGVNVLLSVFKLIAGWIGKSGAMLSDAVHSLSDVFSTIIVMVGIAISKKESDTNHQYGHERLECVAAIVLSVLLFLVGCGIGLGGVEKIVSGNLEESVVPGKIALLAAIVSILVKEWMYWYTRGAAKKIHSGALMADAWHHRSDALSSIGAFLGIGAARMGYPIFEPIASIVICIFIGKAAYEIFKDAIDKMVDHSCDANTIQEMEKLILAQEGVCKIDSLQTRLFGAKIYVDIEIAADGSLTLAEGHDIAQRVHDAIEDANPLVKHCMVHVNPV